VPKFDRVVLNIACLALAGAAGAAAAQVELADEEPADDPTTRSVLVNVPLQDEQPEAFVAPFGYEPRRLFYRESRFIVPARAFDPIAADPRWPRFEFGFTRVIDGDGSELFGDNGPYNNIWLVSFGDTIALYGGPPPEFLKSVIDTVEVGAVASLFATFDLSEESVPLLNADYNGGGYISARKDSWSGLLRVFHESSHLGDELLLLGPDINRQDQTFDSVELLVSKDFFNAWDAGDLRVYGGVGWLFQTFGEPSYGDWVFQYGVEFDARSYRYNLPGGLGMRPIAAIDLQHLDGRGYNIDISLIGGLRFDGIRGGGQADVTAIYYNGRNQNGQLFVDDIETFGVTLRLNL
jgi:hypothetical protein